MKKNHTGDEKSVPRTDRTCSPRREGAAYRSHINRGTQIPKIKSRTRSKLDRSRSSHTHKHAKNHISRSEWFSLVGVHGSCYGPFLTALPGSFGTRTVRRFPRTPVDWSELVVEMLHKILVQLKHCTPIFRLGTVSKTV